MADLFIDGDALTRMRTNLAQLGDAMTRPGRDLGAIEPLSAGGKELRERMGEFGDEWSHGVGKLAKFAGTAGEALAHIERTFRDADDALTRALTGTSPPPSGAGP